MNAVQTLVKMVMNPHTDWGKTLRAHTQEHLTMVSYTTHAQIRPPREWTSIERWGRGLIVNNETGHVVCLPFEKFFNWGTLPASGTPVEVWEKLDGTMIAVWYDRTGWRCSTKGSFDNEHIQIAQQMVDRLDLTPIPPTWTLIFELIHPQSRVVVDYGNRRELVLIGIRDRELGYDYLRFKLKEVAQLIGVSLPHIYDFSDIESLLRDLNTFEGEGVVVRMDNGERWKMKTDTYLEMHRLITGLSWKGVVNLFINHPHDVDEQLQLMRESLPDEFLDTLNRWEKMIKDELDQKMAEIKHINTIAPGGDDKTAALWLQEHHPDLFHPVMAWRRGKEVRKGLLRNMLERLQNERMWG